MQVGPTARALENKIIGNNLVLNQISKFLKCSKYFTLKLKR